MNFEPQSGASTAAVEVPAGFLGYTPIGLSSNPTSMSDFETPLVSRPTVPFGTSTTVTAPLTRECGTTLQLKHADFPVLQGSPGGWLATQDDGTQTSYGNLFWALAATTAANTINYLLTTHFDISFKDLLDPALISARLMQSHPAGIPSSWLGGSDSHALAPYTREAVYQRKLTFVLKNQPTPQIWEDRDDHQLSPYIGNTPASKTGPVDSRTLVDPATGQSYVIPVSVLVMTTP